MKHYILTILFAAGMLMAAPAAMKANCYIEITNIDLGQPAITFAGGVLHVTNAAGQTVVVYNIVGQKVFESKVDSNDKRFDLSLPANCYIVKVGNVARKISVRR